MVTRSESLKMHKASEMREIIEAALDQFMKNSDCFQVSHTLMVLSVTRKQIQREITKLTERFAALELEVTKVRAFERRIDDAEQYSPRLCLRIDNA